MKGWVIDRDHLNDDGFADRVGWGQTDTEAIVADFDSLRPVVTMRESLTTIEDPVRWRALDDDGEVHYSGTVTADWLCGDPDYAYHIVGFVQATDVQFKAADVERYNPGLVARHRELGLVRDGWLNVYG